MSAEDNTQHPHHFVSPNQAPNVQNPEYETELSSIFLYGTLMASPLLAWLVTGERSQVDLVRRRCAKATLYGYSRRAIVGADYPALIKADDTGPLVEGLIFYPRNEGDIRKLVNFEGEPYRRERVDVMLETGERKQAYVFLWYGEEKLLSESEWRFHEFELERLEDWLDLFEGMEFI
jgi:gamma-glutamylcyclotransferase (GGCT)/AIG2-like uncharacterized protein YtfP